MIEMLFTVHWEASGWRGWLADGTDVRYTAPYHLSVTLPPSRLAAGYHASMVAQTAKIERRWRVALGLAAKAAEPQRSVTSIARSLGLTPSVLARAIRRATL